MTTRKAQKKTRATFPNPILTIKNLWGQRFVRPMELAPIQWIHRELESHWIKYQLSRPYPLMLSNESVGAYGERLAAVYLQRKMLFILERSFRAFTGEIDLVAAWRKKTLVFVEVKTWLHAGAAHEGPSDRVDLQKQEKITKTALRYMKQHRLLETASRFDVVEVILEPTTGIGPTFRHFENAFEAVGRYQMYS